MRRILYLLFLSSLFAVELPNQVLSTPEEIFTLSSSEDSLIGGLISPFSGQLALRVTDLVAKGTQPIHFQRSYISPYVSYPTATGNDYWDFCNRRDFFRSLKDTYRGWASIPQICIRIFEDRILYTDPTGITLEFSLVNGSLLTAPYGISNASQDKPSGAFDFRNIRIVKQGDQLVLNSPDGTQRHYAHLATLGLYILKKEILPNGKILRYHIDSSSITIQSLDPLERHIYSSLRIDGEKAFEKLSGNGGIDQATYDLQVLFRHQERFEKNKKDKDSSIPSSEGCNFALPSVLSAVSCPSYRHETIGYNSHLQLVSFASKNAHFSLQYKGSPSKVEKLFLPVGEKGEMIDVYTMSYDPPIAGQKGGKTIAYRKDGSRIEYTCNKNFLLEEVSYFDPDGKLKKQKTLEWDGQGRLKTVLWKDGENNLFWGRKYDNYDSFGNARKETFYGDLSGNQEIEEYTIEKEYSQEGRNLLLKESNEEGKVIAYEYAPNTNLLKVKLTLKNKNILLREFWEYDEDCLNLIETILDDGHSKKKEELEGVTERTVTRYRLRQNVPYLHMPEWIETFYWNGEKEQLFRKIELKYDKWGNVSEEHIYDSNDQFAYKVTREYDEQGNLLSETNPLQYAAVNTYTPKGLRETEKSFSGRLEVKKGYDLRGRLKQVDEVDLENKALHTTKYDYNHLDRRIKKTDYLKQVTQYDHDPISGEACLIEGPKLGDQEVKTVLAFDGLGRKISEKDPNKHETLFRYTAYSKIAEISYPDGSKETFTYYKNGTLKSHTDQNALEVRYKYDLFNRVKEKTYVFQEAPIAEETYDYNTFHLIQYTDREKCVTKYEYNAAGLKFKETHLGRLNSNTKPQFTTFEYDPLARLEIVTESDLIKTKYKRDLLGQVTEMTKTDQVRKILYKIGYEWDPDGHKIATIRYPHNLAAKETYSFDPFGRIIEYKDALGFASTTKYEETAFLQETTTDPNGIITIKTYDPYGRISTLKRGAEYNQKKSYDPAGNLQQIEEGALKTGYEYDSLNRVKTLTRAKGTTHERITKYTYHPGGELKTKTLPDDTILTFSYTPLGYLQTVDASDNTIHQVFECNLNGQIFSATDGKCHLTRKLDDFGNLISETLNGLTLTKTYDPLNRLTSLTLPDHGSIIYTYNSLYPKTAQRLSSEGKELYVHSYESYDLSGNLLCEHPIYNLEPQSYTWNPTGTQNTIESPYFTQTITYDSASRVKSISSDGSYKYNDRSELILEELPLGKCTYSYDSHQNRNEKNGVVSTHNLLDELDRFEHDLNGNLKKNGPFRYRYDALNRLIEAQSDDTHITFIYDALDRCREKTINGSNQLFLYHGNEELGSFTPNGTSKELKIPGSHHKPIAIELEKQVFAPILDYRGNLRRLISRSSKVVQSYDYTAFGEELTELQTPYNPWRYSAKRFDPHIQLSYFGKRYYDPFLGRWITTDPAGFIDGTNLYTYTHNNALSYFDPDGRFIFVIPLVALTWETVFWASIGMTAAYATTSMVESSIRSGSISATAGEITSSAIGGIAGSMITNSLSNYEFASGSSTTLALCGDQLEFTYLGKQGERRSSDEPGSPPYRGDKLPGNGAARPAEGFEWKGNGKPGSSEGNWVKGKGDAKERLYPDLNHGPPQGKHWDYSGPDFPKGTRLYPDGTWEIK